MSSQDLLWLHSSGPVSPAFELAAHLPFSSGNMYGTRFPSSAGCATWWPHQIDDDRRRIPGISPIDEEAATDLAPEPLVEFQQATLGEVDQQKPACWSIRRRQSIWPLMCDAPKCAFGRSRTPITWKDRCSEYWFAFSSAARSAFRRAGPGPHHRLEPLFVARPSTSFARELQP